MCGNIISGSILNPISSNQVVEVGIPKNGCVNFCGNTLNDWLDYFQNKYCELKAQEVIHWSDLEIGCMLNLLGIQDIEPKNADTILPKIIDSICFLKTQIDSAVMGTYNELVLYTPWASATGTTASVLKIGRQVTLRGTLTEGTIANFNLFQLPVGFRPNFKQRFPVAHTYTDSVYFNLFVEIDATGVARLRVTGVSPVSTGDIFLDGITFFIT